MRCLVGGLLAGLALAPVAAAQTVEFYLPSDSVLTILTGETRSIELQVNGTGGVKAYSITVLLDRSRVDIAAVDTVPGGYGLPKPTLTVYTDSIVLAASGTGSSAFTVPVANVTFSMSAGAVQGSLVSLRVSSLTRADGSDALPAHRVGLLDVCQAAKMRGDVTGERLVNSRDALIVLTASVGLPDGGFDVPSGDADGDGQVASRDALFILSYGIGVYTGLPNLGWGIANACAPLAGAPEDLLFFRSSDVYRVAVGDTVPKLQTLPLVPYNAYRPSWSPDRSRVLYTAYTLSYYYEIVAVDTLGTMVDTLTRDGSYDAGADWSPDGTRIAFVSNRVSPVSVYVMNADGTGQTRSTTTVNVNTSEPVSWSPDGNSIAFIGYQGACCPYGLWTVAPDGSALTEVVLGSAGESPQRPVWTAKGDSILYYNASQAYVYQVAATAGATGRPATRVTGAAYYPAAASTGTGFQSTYRYPYDFLLRRVTDGRYLRLVRNDANSNDDNYAFHRTSVFVSSVTVTPNPTTITRSISSTQQLTATVLNSDASQNTTVPVTWDTRDPQIVMVDGAGLATAGASDGTTYIVATVRGWRTDSTRVTVLP